ncbi:MAG: hydroxyacylglutathione hydrolase [Burkholderiaceae bacterium]|jgi:hydroxyacylglutathione hydrolase|nr:hydroxyacylglutathione hydrolase [Burkholderiaceae bacterium]
MALHPDFAVEPVPAFDDNYIWLIVRGRDAAVVDPGDAAPVLRRLEQRALALRTILVTHHHGDHVGGVARLARATGASVHGPRGEPIPALDVPLAGGERIDVLGEAFDVLAVPGHTLGHIAYHAPALRMLFCGDTLFAAGCGRLFEGTAVQMAASLARLAALAGDTRVYCAHEYTAANLRFAREVEPGSAALLGRQRACAALRERGEPTVPSTMADELATNPFLRCAEPAVRGAAEARAGRSLPTTEAVFAVLREWKNAF